MLQRMRKKHPIGYCIAVELLFLLSILLLANAATLLLLLAGGERTAALFVQAPYLGNLLQELIGLAAALAILWRSGRLWAVARRGCGFLDGLLVGMYPFVMSCFVAGMTFLQAGDGALEPAWKIAVFFAAMILVGVVEELVFRGAVAGVLLEHFGPSRAGVWKACLLSGLLFGAAHLSNLLSMAPLGVLVQVCNTTALGMLYTAIYYRTGNLWVPIFLHAFNDIAALILSGLYGSGTMVDEVSSYSVANLAGMAVYLIPVLILLRRSRLAEIAAFSGVEETPPETGQPS